MTHKKGIMIYALQSLRPIWKNYKRRTTQWWIHNCYVEYCTDFTEHCSLCKQLGTSIEFDFSHTFLVSQPIYYNKWVILVPPSETLWSYMVWRDYFKIINSLLIWFVTCRVILDSLLKPASLWYHILI